MKLMPTIPRPTTTMFLRVPTAMVALFTDYPQTIRRVIHRMTAMGK